MAARFLNQEMSSEISGEIETFYRKLEKKYYNGLAQDAIPQKLALQDLFKELKEMKERTMKVHSESSPRVTYMTWPAVKYGTGRKQLCEGNI